jgi:hypothetical protein
VQGRRFLLDALEGGSIKLSFRIGSNDVDDEEIGILCGKLGSEITFTLIAPEVKEEAAGDRWHDGGVRARSSRRRRTFRG